TLSGNAVPVKEDLSSGRCLQQVDTPEQSGFTGAGCPDNTGHIACMYSKINISQDLIISKSLRQMPDFQNRFPAHCFFLLFLLCLDSLSAASAYSLLFSSNGVPRSG